ncbi:cytochrome c oxidase subunit II [soil metagenome]
MKAKENYPQMNTDKLKQDRQEEQDKRKILSVCICVHLWTKKMVFNNRLFFVLLSFVLSGCRGSQSALDSAGVQSARLENLWWLFFFVCGAIYLIVMAVLLAAFFRSRREQKRANSETQPDVRPNPEREKRLGNIVKGAVAVTIIVLFVFMIASFRTGRAVNSLREAEQPLVIKVTGHQWWWEIEYQDRIPSNNISMANEIHIPVGRPVKFELQSTDVIHSFWVPNLHGKKDLIPGYKTTFVFQADKPGTFWGQCAEFCGHQHAKMRFIVVAESPEDFNNWVVAQRQSSVQPATNLQKRGQEVFLTTTCAQCHTSQGTPADGRVGPNLTHIASRSYIAAGSLPNTKGHLGGWISDPQKIKPGVRMPMNSYSSEDLQALLEYLQTLK